MVVLAAMTTYNDVIEDDGHANMKQVVVVTILPIDFGSGFEYHIVQHTVGFSIHFCTECCTPLPNTSREPEVIPI